MASEQKQTTSLKAWAVVSCMVSFTAAIVKFFDGHPIFGFVLALLSIYLYNLAGNRQERREPSLTERSLTSFTNLLDDPPMWVVILFVVLIGIIIYALRVSGVSGSDID